MKKEKKKGLEEGTTNFMMNGNCNLLEHSKMRRLFVFVLVINLQPQLQIRSKPALWNASGPFNYSSFASRLDVKLSQERAWEKVQEEGFAFLFCSA